MTDQYQPQRGSASRLLARKGFVVYLTPQAEAAAYNPASGATVVKSDPVALSAVESEFPSSVVDGTLIRRGDKRMIVEGGKVEPKADDTLTINGVPHQVMSVRGVSPAGVGIIYIVQARSGG